MSASHPEPTSTASESGLGLAPDGGHCTDRQNAILNGTELQQRNWPSPGKQTFTSENATGFWPHTRSQGGTGSRLAPELLIRRPCRDQIGDVFDVNVTRQPGASAAPTNVRHGPARHLLQFFQRQLDHLIIMFVLH